MRNDDALIAIRKHCMACSGGCRQLVEHCSITSCNLYPFRSIRAMIEADKDGKQDAVRGQVSIYDLIEV